MKERKILKGCLCILAILIAGMLLLVGCFTYVTKYRITDVDSIVSHDGSYKVMFQSVGEPEFPFGYSHARLVLQHNGKTITKWKFDVANDGGILTPNDWSVRWENDCVEVTVSGEEQPDEMYTLYFDGRTERMQLDTKNGEWK